MAAEVPPQHAAVSPAVPSPDLNEESDSGDVGGSFVIVDPATVIADPLEITADLEENDEISAADEKIEKENSHELLEGNVGSEEGGGENIISAEDDTTVYDAKVCEKSESDKLHDHNEKKEIEENGEKSENDELHVEDEEKEITENGGISEENELHVEDETKDSVENGEALEKDELHGEDEKKDSEEDGEKLVENVLHGVNEEEEVEEKSENLEENVLHVENEKKEMKENGTNLEDNVLHVEFEKEIEKNCEKLEENVLHGEDEKKGSEENGEASEKDELHVDGVDTEDRDEVVCVNAEMDNNQVKIVENKFDEEDHIDEQKEEACEKENEKDGELGLKHEQEQVYGEPIVEEEQVNEEDEIDEKKLAEIEQVVIDKADPETITKAEEDEKESSVYVTTEAEQAVAPEVEIVDREMNDESKSENNRQAGDEDAISNTDNLHMGSEASPCLQIHDEAKGSELADEEKVEPVKVEDADEKVMVDEAEDSEVVQDTDEKDKPIYLIMVPRFTNREKLEEKAIIQAELVEKTKARDYINASIKEQKVIVSENQQKLEAAKAEEHIVRSKINDKRKEIESVQSVIDLMKNANSLDDIDDQILNVERMIQHETMPLRQEKQYLSDIKRLKHRREELSSNMGPEKDIQEAFQQKDQIGERLKLLRKEFDSLKNELSLAENTTKAAGKKLYDERQVLKDMQNQFQAASSLREEVYAQLKKVNSELNALNKQFYAFKDARTAAEKLRASKDTEGLRSYCRNQAERIMEMWNNDEEFRKQYVKFNEARTVRRLGTPDGRALGPNEKPLVLQTSVDQLSSKPVLLSSNTEKPADSDSFAKSSSKEKNTGPEQGMVLNQESNSEKSSKTSKDKNVVPSSGTMQANQESKSKKSSMPASKKNLQTIVPIEDEADEVEIPKTLTKEEEELARKEEELRKEKAAAELKEQLRLEQRAKTKEAEERKKRKAEKAQAKAEYKKQKEAEEKEKRRAKKDKKKAGTAEADVAADLLATEPSPSVTVLESESTVTTVTKRTSRPVPLTKKYSNAKTVPLPLRNRSKRKIQTWMWVVLLCVLVAVLFFAGNYISSSNLIPPSFGF